MSEPSGTTDLEEPPAHPRAGGLAAPADWRLPIRGFIPLVLAATLLLQSVFWLWARSTPLAIPYLVIVWSFLGLALTLVGMGWAAVIALADDPKRGILFASLPPYLIWYTCTRWPLVGQPMTVFFCGLALSAVSMWSGLEMLKAYAESIPASN